MYDEYQEPQFPKPGNSIEDFWTLNLSICSCDVIHTASTKLGGEEGKNHLKHE
jgi:hypothetical protein